MRKPWLTTNRKATDRVGKGLQIIQIVAQTKDLWDVSAPITEKRTRKEKKEGVREETDPRKGEHDEGGIANCGGFAIQDGKGMAVNLGQGKQLKGLKREKKKCNRSQNSREQGILRRASCKGKKMGPQLNITV